MSHKDLQSELSGYSDAELCRLVSVGDNLAFEEITNRYKGLIHLISKEYSYPGFDSGDFLQLGLMGLFKACLSYNESNNISFKNYAALCIRRRYISLTKSQTSKKAIPQQSIVSIDSIPITDYSVNPEELVSDKESDSDFLNIVKSRLSHMEFLVMEGYVNGLSYNEIANNLGLDKKAVDNALQRVRKKLLN